MLKQLSGGLSSSDSNNTSPADVNSCNLLQVRDNARRGVHKQELMADAKSQRSPLYMANIYSQYIWLFKSM